MAGELIWSRTALDDIEAIAAFIARDSLIHARRTVEQIIACGERLLVQPALGEIAPESSRETVHEYGLYSFRMLFERQGQDLHLLAIIHDRGRQHIETPPPRLPQITERPVAAAAHENPWLASPVPGTSTPVILDPLDDLHYLE